MKLWVDDIRNAPDDTWTVARTITEAIRFLSMFNPDEISLDHDISHQVVMGDVSRPYPCPETFASVALFIARKYWQEVPVNKNTVAVSGNHVPKITIHTANPVGAKLMNDILLVVGIKSEIKPMSAANRLEREI